MAKKSASPFDTIESAHGFVQFLSSTLAETKKEVSADIEREINGDPNRRRDAMLVAMYNLERLEYHLTRSARLLNDLRSIRRLLLEERTSSGKVARVPQPVEAAHAATVPKNGKAVAVA